MVYESIASTIRKPTYTPVYSDPFFVEYARSGSCNDGKFWWAKEDAGKIYLFGLCSFFGLFFRRFFFSVIIVFLKNSVMKLDFAQIQRHGKFHELIDTNPSIFVGKLCNFFFQVRNLKKEEKLWKKSSSLAELKFRPAEDLKI